MATVVLSASNALVVLLDEAGWDGLEAPETFADHWPDEPDVAVAVYEQTGLGGRLRFRGGPGTLHVRCVVRARAGLRQFAECQTLAWRAWEVLSRHDPTVVSGAALAAAFPRYRAGDLADVHLEAFEAIRPPVVVESENDDRPVFTFDVGVWVRTPTC